MEKSLLESNFHDVQPIDRRLAEKIFNSNNFDEICDALIRITYYDSDYKWVQGKCIMLLKGNDLSIKRLAITCLGHLARIHKKLDKELVVALLKKLKEDKDVSGAAEDALDDIDIFLS